MRTTEVYERCLEAILKSDVFGIATRAGLLPNRASKRKMVKGIIRYALHWGTGHPALIAVSEAEREEAIQYEDFAEAIHPCSSANGRRLERALEVLRREFPSHSCFYRSSSEEYLFSERFLRELEAERRNR